MKIVPGCALKSFDSSNSSNNIKNQPPKKLNSNSNSSRSNSKPTQSNRGKSRANNGEDSFYSAILGWHFEKLKSNSRQALGLVPLRRGNRFSSVIDYYRNMKELVCTVAFFNCCIFNENKCRLYSVMDESINIHNMIGI
jgi:hypothetical protein